MQMEIRDANITSEPLYIYRMSDDEATDVLWFVYINIMQINSMWSKNETWLAISMDWVSKITDGPKN